MKISAVAAVTTVACLLMGCAALAQHPQSANTQRGASKASGPPTEDRVRVRLQLNPNDAAAHKELIKLLEKKYAFRAIVAEDTTWLSNNPSD